ncbi:HNH endonuclease signature motif containing protein [Pseudochelatococcus sp. B33]
MTDAPATRRKITTLDKLKVVVAQATCPLCGGRLGDLTGLDFDHAVPLALGGADDLSNLRAVHRDCHKAKTNGRPATSAGGDIHAIAKAKRLARDASDFDMRILAKANGDDPPPEQRRKRKIASRPFPKRKSK